MPTLIQKTAGWYIVENRRVNGKQKRDYLKSLGKITERQAIVELDHYEKTQGRARSGKMTVWQLFNEYRAMVISERSERSQIHHDYVLAQIDPHIGHVQLREFEFQNMEQLRVELMKFQPGKRRQRGPATVRKLLGYVIAVFNFGQRMGRVSNVPPLPKVRVIKKPIHRLYPSEVDKLLKATDHPVFANQRFVIQILLGSGIRPHELEQLNWADVDLPRRRMMIRQIGEYKKGGVVPIPDELLEVLIPIHPKQGRVCPYPVGGYIKAMQRLSKRVGIKFSAGTFRKTFASSMFEKGVDIHTIANILRHDPATTLAWYAEFQIDHLAASMQHNPLSGTRAGTQIDLPGDAASYGLLKSDL